MNRTVIVLIVSVTSMGAWDADGHRPSTGRGSPAAGPAADTSGGVGGMIGGPHDFSRFGGNACSACHIPHVQGVRLTTQPSTQPAAEMFRIPGQRRVFVPDRYTPGPTSLVCLGCHDGTVATSMIGSAHSMLAGVREGFAVPEGFVWRDHPIGVPYAGDRREYRPPAFVEKCRIRLPEGRLECISCHDPHNVAGIDAMLWMSNRRSALCLTCHIK